MLSSEPLSVNESEKNQKLREPISNHSSSRSKLKVRVSTNRFGKKFSSLENRRSLRSSHPQEETEKGIKLLSHNLSALSCSLVLTVVAETQEFVHRKEILQVECLFDQKPTSELRPILERSVSIVERQIIGVTTARNFGLE